MYFQKFSLGKLLKIMVCCENLEVRPTSVPDGIVNPRAKKFVFLGVKRNMKSYKLWDSENKKIVLSQHVTFNETSVLKSTVS